MNYNNSPLVSVILPVHNGGRFIAEALESIQHQSYSNLEIIVIDDGSTDDSANIVRSHAATDNRINLYKRPNRGLVASLNEGLNLSNGKYIARMDADDVSFPERISKQVTYMENNCDVVVLGVSVVKSRHLPFRFKELTGKSVTTWGLLFRNNIGHPGVMIRTKTIKDNKLSYNEDYYCAEDFKLWCELIRFGKADILSDNLLFYRTHPNSVSSLQQKRQAQIDRLIVYENIKIRFGIDLGKYLNRNFRTWLNHVTSEIFCSPSLKELNKHDITSLHLTYQKYCADFGLQTFYHYIRAAGLRYIILAPCRNMINIYHACKQQLSRGWKRMEL